MIPEIITVLASGGVLTGSGFFLSRWVDTVNGTLKELQTGQTETHERLARVEVLCATNTDVGNLVNEVRQLIQRVPRSPLPPLSGS